ncbi:winged helix-turn-helix domain-containing protein [Kutzneria sp. CA-103260]|uniref:winged helix-turn-helix domain-containing protein n=1 Tax=Kutzneria sp. CA-103260 TaxID=2802641 RepID=UPI001BAA47E6|nr:transcriptional regulator [Kutzneria sp. CA-103260]QUQ67652.1 MarR family transcriptional regulator [Kutzneria sp. CA-103260]
MTHPRHQLDERIHTPVRFSLMAALAATGEAEFKALRETLEVSESLLSQHIRVLEGAGYVYVRKGFVGKRPRTWLSLTPEGRQAFDGHVETLRTIVASTPVTRSDQA